MPKRINLPDGFQPEGITTRGGSRAYLGSLADGDIYVANLRTGDGHRIHQGDGTPSVGLKLDGRGRLWVAGGADGDAKVVNVRTGNTVATYDFTSGASFVNDVVLRGNAAWFTDSQRAVLYEVALGARPGRRRTCPHGAAQGRLAPGAPASSTPTGSAPPPAVGRCSSCSRSPASSSGSTRATGLARASAWAATC